MRHGVLPFVAYLAMMLPLVGLHVDWELAHFWFVLQGSNWTFKHHWLTEAVLHDGGHDLAVALYVLILLLYISSFRLVPLKPFRSGLSYLSLSLPLATLSVSLIKRLTLVDCPWSVLDFNGERPYQSWLQSLWSPLNGADHCFPAGHASSAYMFFGLYFFATAFFPKQATRILVGVIGMGLLFGLAQQLRGAHFISHDLTSALICWYVCYGLWLYWQRLLTAA